MTPLILIPSLNLHHKQGQFLKKSFEDDKVIISKLLLFIIYFESVKPFFLKGPNFAARPFGSGGIPLAASGRFPVPRGNTRQSLSTWQKKKDCTGKPHQL
jgi:hypothetical protein